MRCVFSESVKDVRLEDGVPSGVATPGTARHPGFGQRNPLRALAGDLLTAILPACCVVCTGPLPIFERIPVCQPCWDGMKPLQGEGEGTRLLCSRCGDGLPLESRRFEAGYGIDVCGSCRMDEPPFHRAVAYGAFDDELRALLRGLKYGGMMELASRRLGVWMASAAMPLRGDLAGEALVIPVPLGAQRRRERGYNQSALLAAAMCDVLRRDAPEWRLQVREDLLERTRETAALFGLTPAQRRERLRGVFRAPRELRNQLAGRDVLLVDDIMTTGATAEACTTALRRAGARQVCVVTLARTLRGDAAMPWVPSRVALADAYRQQRFRV